MFKYETLVISFHDITYRKDIERKLVDSREKYKKLANNYRNLANIDVLTGLNNRRSFFDRIASLKTGYERERTGFTVIYFDLDGFKQINDVHGHFVGDLVLIAVANRMKSCVREQDGLFRLGGDEFVMLIPGSTSKDAADQRITLIRKSFDQPISVNNLFLKISISAGCAVYPNQEQNLDQLIRKADGEMYKDKQKTKVTKP